MCRNKKFRVPATIGLMMYLVSVLAAPLARAVTVPLSLPLVSVISVSVTPATLSVIQGSIQQYTATATYSDATTANVTSDPSTTWAVGNGQIASVSSSGVVTTTSVGTTSVSATYYSVSGSANLDVTTTTTSPPEQSQGGQVSGSSPGPAPSPPDQGQTPTPPDQGQTPTPPDQGQTPTPPDQGQTPVPPDQGQVPTPPEGQSPTPTPEGEIPPPLPVISIPPFTPDSTPAVVTLVSQPLEPAPLSETLQSLLGEQFLPPVDGLSRGEIVDRILKKFNIEQTKFKLLNDCNIYRRDCLGIFSSYSTFEGLSLLSNLESYHPQSLLERLVPLASAQSTIDTSDMQLYPDVPDGTPFIDAINKATMLAIVNGYYEEPGSPFKPERIVTRIEALKVLLNANDLMKWKYYSELEALLGGPEGVKNQTVPFNDVFPDRGYMWWYPRYINKACEVGIISCKKGTNFSPDEYMTKGDFSNWMNNLEEYFQQNDVPALLSGDPDFDTLPTYIEDNVYLTNPQEKDTDSDKLPDNAEVEQYMTSPFLEDTDAEGLSDFDEVELYNTSPLKVDTDDDTVSDSEEVRAGTDPLDPYSFPTDKNELTGISKSWEDKYNIQVLSGSQDSDRDGIADVLEYQYGTNPVLIDSDSDGFTDSEEILSFHTDPLDSNDPGTLAQLGVRITNFIEGQLVADSQPLVKGVAPANVVVEVVLRNNFGHEKILGQTVSDENDIFIFQVPQPIRDGKYILLARALLPEKKQVLESPPVGIVIDSTLNVPAPSPKKLADKPITEDVLLKDLRVEIRDQKPVLVGKTDFGNKVSATWRSIVVTSALIADTTTGDFNIQAPGELEYGKHEVYVQAVRQKDGAMSKNIRIIFNISAAFPGAEELKPSAPEQGKGGIAAAFSTFAQRQGFLLWLILGFVGVVGVAAGVYCFRGRGSRKK